MANPQTKSNFANEQFDADVKVFIHRRVNMFRQRAALQAADTSEITE